MLNLILRFTFIVLKFIFKKTISLLFTSSPTSPFLSSQIFICKQVTSSFFSSSQKNYFIVNDFYRMFVERTYKIRLLRSQIDKFFSSIFNNSNLFIFKIFSSRVSFISIFIQTRITLYFNFIDLFAVKSLNNEIFIIIHNSIKFSARLLFINIAFCPFTALIVKLTNTVIIQIIYSSKKFSI